MRDFIERLKSKPEHIRRRIALGTAAGITGVVTVVWAGALIFSGALGIPQNTGASVPGTLATGDGGSDSTAQAPAKTNFEQLLGAVGVTTQQSAAPALTPVDVTPPAATATAPTVIPF
jgi:hypothetical protein